MKAIVEGPRLPVLLEELRAFCRFHNLQLTVSEGPGHTSSRSRRQIPVEKVYDAFREHGSVPAAARDLGIPPGTVWDRLKAAGLLDAPK